MRTNFGLTVSVTAFFMLSGLPAAAARAETPATPALEKPTSAEVLDGAFRDAQTATSSRTGLALSRSAARLASGDPELAALISARQAASKSVSATEAARITAHTTAPADPQLIASSERSSDEAHAAFAAADAALAKRSPSYAQITGLSPLTIPEAQKLLTSDEAIILIHTTETHTYVFAVTTGKVDWARSDLGKAAVAAEVQALRAALDGQNVPDLSNPRAAPTGFPRARAFALYQALWAPIAPVITKAKTVYVVAGGSLGGLPLAVLPTQAPTGDDGDLTALRKTHWLVRDVALVTLPSVGSLRALRAGQAHMSASRPFAGFGDPALSGEASISAPRSFNLKRGINGGDVGSVLKSFPRLPGSRAELDALAAVMGADPASVIAGAAATEASVKATPLGNVSVIAFATHGLLAGEIGPNAEPALVMTPPDKPNGDDDGLLTASEAASLHLGADWVVLSACNTAASDGKASGEGLSGLVRGFFSGGARAVLASHWRVRDDAAQALTVGTLSRWRAHPDEGRASALRAAMLDMIDNMANPSWANPSLWAPFILAGDGR